MKIGCRWNAKKNQPPSTFVCARAHLSLRARSFSSSVAPPIAKIPKGDLKAIPRVTHKHRNWAPKSAVRARASHTMCPLRARTYSSLVVAPNRNISKWDLEAMPKVTRKEIELLNLLCTRGARLSHCVPLACTGPYLAYFWTNLHEFWLHA